MRTSYTSHDGPSRSADAPDGEELERPDEHRMEDAHRDLLAVGENVAACSVVPNFEVVHLVRQLPS